MNTEGFRNTWKYIVTKLGCVKPKDEKKNLSRSRLKRYDDSRSIDDFESLSFCPSDCSSCHKAFID